MKYLLVILSLFGAAAHAATISGGSGSSGAPTAGTNISVSGSQVSLADPISISSATITSLTANNTFKVICSSVVTVSSATTTSSFANTALACTGNLSLSSKHALIFANGILVQSATGNTSAAAIYRDSTNLDDPTFGQCGTRTDVTGAASITSTCSMFAYDTPGDTASHTWTVRIAALGGGTATFGNSAKTRLIVLEVD